ncbi:hypothetical protein [Pseudanabaena minima]|uniref:hypothetical protein n=1 Tax=Pseudanabaena minima TaxID=890415 RepID=UPI003DA95935
MKKSVVYRTLQVASAAAVLSMLSIWSSTKHVDVVSNLLAEMGSLLVILAIAVALPYFCFKVLGKLYTPPKSRTTDQSSASATSPLNQDEFNEIIEEAEVMQYRGNRYKPEELQSNSDQTNISQSQPVIKYRGVSIGNSADSSSQDLPDSFPASRDSQKSAKPKERIKYRGSYVD